MTQQNNEGSQRVNHKGAAINMLNRAEQSLIEQNAPFDPQTGLQFALVHATIALADAIDQGNYDDCPNKATCGNNKRKSFRTCYDCSQAQRQGGSPAQGYGGAAPQGYGADGNYQQGNQQQPAQGGDRAW